MTRGEELVDRETDEGGERWPARLEAEAVRGTREVRVTLQVMQCSRLRHSVEIAEHDNWAVLFKHPGLRRRKLRVA